MNQKYKIVINKLTEDIPAIEKGVGVEIKVVNIGFHIYLF